VTEFGVVGFVDQVSAVENFLSWVKGMPQFKSFPVEVARRQEGWYWYVDARG
jgi:hypothetical protein